MLRKQIDAFDKKIVSSLAQRAAVVRKIGAYKKRKNIPILDRKRRKKVLSSRTLRAHKKGFSKTILKKIYSMLHTYMIDLQR